MNEMKNLEIGGASASEFLRIFLIKKCIKNYVGLSMIALNTKKHVPEDHESFARKREGIFDSLRI
ncbi:MAG: hypothetical protein ACOCTR_06240, partial [Candidatus Natronoplasma sp.]